MYKRAEQLTTVYLCNSDDGLETQTMKQKSLVAVVVVLLVVVWSSVVGCRQRT
jgi:hypothetical protein